MALRVLPPPPPAAAAACRSVISGFCSPAYLLNGSHDREGFSHGFSLYCRVHFCDRSIIIEYLYKWASVQFCRSKDQGGSQAGVPERQMAGPNPQKGPTNIPELL